MSPSAIDTIYTGNGHDANLSTKANQASTGYLLDRDLNNAPREVVGSEGSWIILKDGNRIFDATCGAAVSCLGHQNQEVFDAQDAQRRNVSYCHSMFFSTPSTNLLAESLIEGTGSKMSRAFICNSGTEACEAAMKFAIQYHQEIDPTKPRYRFIARLNSYHGASLGSLGLGSHLARREIYEPVLNKNVSYVSECNPYRQRLNNESDAAFVARKADELDKAFVDAPEPVAAFFCEPVSGAALGCVPYVPGYLAAMKAVCRKHGALFVLDEVMSGMGRCGTLHVWQAEHSDGPGGDCVPDIEMIGKGLGGGFEPVAGILLGSHCVQAISGKSGSFKHGQTYQAHPTVCAAAYAVQNIIKRDNLMTNVQYQGQHLEKLLHEKLDGHPNVGNIRGKGLFLGIEFVRNKTTKEPFDNKLKVADRVHNLALTPKYGMSFYPGQGCVDGVLGDHIILAPAYVVTRSEIELVANTIASVIEEVFKDL